MATQFCRQAANACVCRTQGYGCMPWKARPPGNRFEESRAFMGSKLYVGNLSYNTSEEILREAFGADGREVVSVAIINDRDTGRPKGFAFVEMGSDSDARAAMEAWDGQELDGRPLRVNEAQERPPRRNFGGGGGGGPGGGRDRRPGGGGGGGNGGGGRGGRDRDRRGGGW